MRIYSLQALRFFAALAVAGFHAANTAHQATGSFGALGETGALIGRAGVDVFFVLSGLVITLSARETGPREFLVKRVRRIYPIYLLLATPWVIMLAPSGAMDWRRIIATIFLWPITDRATTPALTPAWSLTYEMLFYAQAALVLWVPRLAWPLAALYVIALTHRSNALLQFIGNPIILEFLAGAAMVFLPRRPALVWGIPLGLALLTATTAAGWYPDEPIVGFFTGENAWRRLVALGAPAVLIVAGALQLDIKQGVLTELGDASYSLYLVHTLVLLLLAALLSKAPVALPAEMVVAVGLAGSILLAWRVHQVIEKPLLERLRSLPRLGVRPRADEAAVVRRG